MDITMKQLRGRVPSLFIIFFCVVDEACVCNGLLSKKSLNIPSTMSYQKCLKKVLLSSFDYQLDRLFFLLPFLSSLLFSSSQYRLLDGISFSKSRLLQSYATYYTLYRISALRDDRLWNKYSFIHLE